mmetsp:Transcript_40609/g.100373  ORF Transcript_40609/g.100373 Transcript_40609/m.100373 type:complete len:138 (-) Transcript_40609:93-506(-)
MRNFAVAIHYYRLASDQDFPPSQLSLAEFLIRGTDDERVPKDPRAGAKLLARIAQCGEAQFEHIRLAALKLLRDSADQREVVTACCIGCGASRLLKKCVQYHVARFCGSECMKLMWPTHKRCCKKWAKQGGDDESQQ